MKTALLLILLPLQIFAQDFSGVWKGILSTAGNELSYELVISETGGKLTGYSLSVFTINGVENTGIKSMKIKSRKESISIEDDELIYNNYTTTAKRVTLFSTLNLERKDSLMILQGSFFTRSVDRSTFKGTIRLEKVNSFSATRVVPQLEKMNLLNNLSFVQPKSVEKENNSVPASIPVNKESLPDTLAIEKEEAKMAIAKPERQLKPVSLPAQKNKMTSVSAPPVIKAAPKVIPPSVAAEIASRKTEIIRNIFFQSDSLMLTLYDNGQVDGDTVSVVVNDKVIIARQGLTTTAATTTLYTNKVPGDSLKLIMYAENLGSIPPNTGLLIIQDGNEKYQIRFEGDFQKNSAIILRRKR
ncbi:MAG: hypothetical protein ABI675_00790 [Chitinophagaceae bacterium]